MIVCMYSYGVDSRWSAMLNGDVHALGFSIYERACPGRHFRMLTHYRCHPVHHLVCFANVECN